MNVYQILKDGSTTRFYPAEDVIFVICHIGPGSVCAWDINMKKVPV